MKARDAIQSALRLPNDTPYSFFHARAAKIHAETYQKSLEVHRRRSDWLV